MQLLTQQEKSYLNSGFNDSINFLFSYCPSGLLSLFPAGICAFKYLLGPGFRNGKRWKAVRGNNECSEE